MYVPKKLQEIFILQKETFSNNIIVKGQLCCCKSHCFSMLYYGQMKRKMFYGKVIYPQENALLVNAKCLICGKEASIFNSITDGYDGCVSTEAFSQLSELSEFSCPKCAKAVFSIALSFEYQPEEELIEDGIQDYENAFSWIWISPTCLSCGKTYKNLVDMETA